MNDKEIIINVLPAAGFVAGYGLLCCVTFGVSRRPGKVVIHRIFVAASEELLSACWMFMEATSR